MAPAIRWWKPLTLPRFENLTRLETEIRVSPEKPAVVGIVERRRNGTKPQLKKADLTGLQADQALRCCPGSFEGWIQVRPRGEQVPFSPLVQEPGPGRRNL